MTIALTLRTLAVLALLSTSAWADVTVWTNGERGNSNYVTWSQKPDDISDVNMDDFKTKNQNGDWLNCRGGWALVDCPMTKNAGDGQWKVNEDCSVTKDVEANIFCVDENPLTGCTKTADIKKVLTDKGANNTANVNCTDVSGSKSCTVPASAITCKSDKEIPLDSTITCVEGEPFTYSAVCQPFCAVKTELLNDAGIDASKCTNKLTKGTSCAITTHAGWEHKSGIKTILQCNGTHTIDATEASSQGIALSKCAKGKWSIGGTMTKCIDCQAGKWSSTTKTPSSEQCESCTGGKWSKVTGATSKETCTECTAGKWSKVTGATSKETCKQCPAGEWSKDGAKSAESCKPAECRIIANLKPTNKHWWCARGANDTRRCDKGDPGSATRTNMMVLDWELVNTNKIGFCFAHLRHNAKRYKSIDLRKVCDTRKQTPSYKIDWMGSTKKTHRGQWEFIRLCWSPDESGCIWNGETFQADETDDTTTIDTSDWSTWKTVTVICGVSAFLAIIALAVWRRCIANNKTTTNDRQEVGMTVSA